MLISTGRIDALVFFLVSLALFYLFMRQAKNKVKFKIRTLRPVTAIPEAVGRAAEMGKPIYYTTGDGNETLNDQTNAPQILAGLSILSYVTKLCAEAGVKIVYFTPIANSIALVEETMRLSYLSAGKTEEFDRTTQVQYQGDQGAYVSASLGWMQREKPASSFLIGGFYYESVVLGSAGNAINAMQISGTANTAQIPFLVATTDYTLIMEEMYAASAVISGDTDVLGSLRGEDILKFVLIALLAIGIIVGLAGSTLIITLLKM